MKHKFAYINHINGLVQDCRNSSVSTMVSISAQNVHT